MDETRADQGKGEPTGYGPDEDVIAEVLKLRRFAGSYAPGEDGVVYFVDETKDRPFELGEQYIPVLADACRRVQHREREQHANLERADRRIEELNERIRQFAFEAGQSAGEEIKRRLAKPEAPAADEIARLSVPQLVERVLDVEVKHLCGETYTVTRRMPEGVPDMVWAWERYHLGMLGDVCRMLLRQRARQTDPMPLPLIPLADRQPGEREPEKEATLPTDVSPLDQRMRDANLICKLLGMKWEPDGTGLFVCFLDGQGGEFRLDEDELPVLARACHKVEEKATQSTSPDGSPDRIDAIIDMGEAELLQVAIGAQLDRRLNDYHIRWHGHTFTGSWESPYLGMVLHACRKKLMAEHDRDEAERKLFELSRQMGGMIGEHHKRVEELEAQIASQGETREASELQTRLDQALEIIKQREADVAALREKQADIEEAGEMQAVYYMARAEKMEKELAELKERGEQAQADFVGFARAAGGLAPGGYVHVGPPRGVSYLDRIKGTLHRVVGDWFPDAGARWLTDEPSPPPPAVGPYDAGPQGENKWPADLRQPHTQEQRQARTAAYQQDMAEQGFLLASKEELSDDERLAQRAQAEQAKHQEELASVIKRHGQRLRERGTTDPEAPKRTRTLVIIGWRDQTIEVKEQDMTEGEFTFSGERVTQQFPPSYRGMDVTDEDEHAALVGQIRREFHERYQLSDPGPGARQEIRDLHASMLAARERWIEERVAERLSELDGPEDEDEKLPPHLERVEVARMVLSDGPELQAMAHPGGGEGHTSEDIERIEREQEERGEVNEHDLGDSIETVEVDTQKYTGGIRKVMRETREARAKDIYDHMDKLGNMDETDETDGPDDRYFGGRDFGIATIKTEGERIYVDNSPEGRAQADAAAARRKAEEPFHALVVFARELDARYSLLVEILDGAECIDWDKLGPVQASTVRGIMAEADVRDTFNDIAGRF